MSAPRFRYLTKSYVEWLGLTEFPTPVWNPTAYFIPENAAKPETQSRFKQAVEFEGGTYLKSDDGLSYDLIGAPVAVP